MPDPGPRYSDYLTVKEAAVLEQVSERVIQKRVADDQYQVKEIKGSGGNSGTRFLIDPQSLSPPGRLRYLQKNCPDQINNAALEALDDMAAQRLLSLREAILRLQRAGRGQKDQMARDICDQYGLSRSALYRLRKAYQEKGSPSALLRKQRADLMGSRTFSREALEIGIAEYLLSLNKLNAYEKLKAEALIHGWHYGSYRSFCRILNRLVDQDEALMAYARDGRRGLANRAIPTIERDTSDLLPNEFLCGDHHQFDLFVHDEQRGKVYRPWLTAWQDMRTRAIVGWVICQQPNSRSIAQALQYALDDEDQDGQPKRRHYGVPQNAYIDNGKDYRSYYISGGRWKYTRFKAPDYDLMSRAVLAELNVDTTFALPFNPQSKPIERLFKTIEHQLVEHLPGFCGHTYESRPHHQLMQQIKNRQLLTLEQFQVLLREWIEKRYHEAEHSGRGTGGRSPNEVWDICQQQGWGPTTLGDRRILHLLFMMSADRKVTRNGLEFMNRRYRHDDLVFYVGKTVEVRWDPDDLSQIYVFNERQFICIAQAYDYASMHMSKEELGDRMRHKRHLAKEVEGRYAHLTFGVIKPDNTGSPGTWGKALRENYGPAADEQARQKEREKARRPQKISGDILLTPPPGYFDEDFDQ
ncbi:MAG: Mu transposase C-terminal domain-containing protein, partial [Candidatus Neomarinimicrobiota bacterium]